MAEREYVARAQRRFAAHPSLVWALVADTNRFDRAVGLTPAEYTYRPSADGTEQVPVARARQLGFDIEWLEPPYEWVEGRSVRGTREFVKGPLSTGAFEVKLTPDDGATQLEAKLVLKGDTFALRIAGPIMRGQIQRGIGRYFDAIEKLLARETMRLQGVNEPPASIARRVMMSAPVDRVATSPVSPIDEAEFEHRARRFAQAPPSEAARSHLLAFIREQPDDEVAQMRAFEIARAWDLDRRDVLRAFLFAARAGLVDLNWQLNCPTCRVGAEVEGTLSKVGKSGHCAACNISYELDFARHIEAVFRVNPAVRVTEHALYCASSPWFRPHVFSQLRIAANTTERFAAEVPAGSLLIRTLTGQRSVVVNEHDDEALPPARLTVTITDRGIAVTPEGEAAPGGVTDVALENQTDERMTLLIERAGWNADIVRGSVITTFPDFIDLFATEAPAAGIDLTVGSLTLLFTDLTGSTAMYERIGDARAFAIVQEHFGLLAEATTAHKGAIVKTMGDAIMASFASPADALAAGIEMIEKTHIAHGAVGLTMKVGLHEGPCLAVRANERLDFFGTTVNVAARLQAQARESEIVVMNDLLGHSEIARILAAKGFPRREFDAQLKGIRDTQRLVGIDARPAKGP